jgi:hypothetical protein
MKLTTKIILGLLGGLIVSGIINFVQWKIYHREPVIETVIERDTVTQLDTLYEHIRHDSIVYMPKPVKVLDTVKIYRDTIFHKYGWIEREESVRGTLLSKKLEYEFDIPTYYKNRTITNTITHTIRNNLFYLNGGFNYNYADQGLYPQFGVTYIWNNHKRMISLEYSLDKRVDLSVGISLWR